MNKIGKKLAKTAFELVLDHEKQRYEAKRKRGVATKSDWRKKQIFDSLQKTIR